MTPDSNNLLVALHKWARQQDENFITDSFAHLLQHLFLHSPSAGAHVLSQLTSGSMQVDPAELGAASVKTQFATPYGIPDLVIEVGHRLVVLEAKVEAEADCRQLSNYRQWLSEESVQQQYSQRLLVFLTRYPVDESIATQIDALGVIPRRWCQVALWLEEVLSEDKLGDRVSEYIVLQFLEFLRCRKIAMTQIGEEIVTGLASLRNLQIMIGEAATHSGLSTVRSSAWDYIGYYLQKNRYWIGVLYDRPQFLEFQTNEMPVSEELRKSKGLSGFVEEKWWAKGQMRWVDRLDLIESGFTSLSTSDQLERLQQFMQASVATAELICPAPA